MDTAGSVTDNNIGIFLDAFGNCVEYNRRRVRPLIVFYNIDTGTVRPDFQLVNRRGTEGVGRSEDDLFPLRG